MRNRTAQSSASFFSWLYQDSGAPRSASKAALRPITVNAPANGKTAKGEQPVFSRAAVMGGVGGAILILGAILLGTNNFLAFFSLEGLMIVVGGSIAVSFMSFQPEDVISALRSIKTMFHQSPPENLHHDMQNILNWARIVQTRGMRGLEEEVGNIDEPFVRYSLNMAVSNYEPEDVRSMMETAADADYERDTAPAQILSAMAGNAPAFGMVGTLVGMVIMLVNFRSDMAGVGPGLAVSFLSTLYGVITARMVYIPAASKLLRQQDNARFRNHLITEGIVMLVANKTPHFIHDRLNSFLRPESFDGIDAGVQSRIMQKRRAV